MAHFSTNPQVQTKIHQELKKVKEKNEVKANTPFKTGDEVRVLSTRDPSLTSKERNEIITGFHIQKICETLVDKTNIHDTESSKQLLPFAWL